MRGHTLGAPALSIQAMEPPPAPISTISAVGTRIGYPAKSRLASILYSVVILGVSFSTRDVFAVVPPTSNEITLGSPTIRPIAAAPITPATGPDSTSRIGLRLPALNVAL